MNKQKILLKITGSAFLPSPTHANQPPLLHLIDQIKQLEPTHFFGIVVGGGNFFRGAQQGVAWSMTPSVAHTVGMLATLMNGLILKDVLQRHGISVALLSALTCPDTQPVSHTTITHAYTSASCIVFSGGTGNPFFTTDTTAVLRALQMNANQVWKATNVDGVYSADPRKDPNAQFLRHLSYTDAITRQLTIMDLPAFALAQEHHMPIRIFNAYTPHILTRIAHQEEIGTIISS